MPTNSPQPLLPRTSQRTFCARMHERLKAALRASFVLAALTIAAFAVPQNAPPAPIAPEASTLTEGVNAGEIQIELEKFGVGNMARVGDWCGVRIRINDSATKQRELILRLECLDADGDKPLYQMNMTANPGVWQSAWLYCRLPFEYANRGGEIVKVTVYEGIETTDASEPGTPGYRAGKLLGALPIAPKNSGAIVPGPVGLIAVLGTRSLGLSQYNNRAGATDTYHKIANEATEIVDAINPEDLPDRWMGLAPFEAIVWADGDPSKLRGERSKAMRDWINRGGHLIVILPPIGQTWTNAASNELFDIMPLVEVKLREKTPFDDYRPLLTTSKDVNFPKTSTVQTLTPKTDAGPGEAVRILNGPDGECVVARREVGAGAITLIGLDLNQTALSQFAMIDAEVFWHRLLGRRGDLLDPVPDPNQRAGSVTTSLPGSRRQIPLDNVAAQISRTGTASAGVLVGFVVFALYWAVAGPVGFAMLKRRGLAQHAWIFFVAAAAVFTALAWGGATAMRPKRTEAWHLTILDHVFGQPLQRGRMWASVLLPWYGDATLAVGEPGSMGNGTGGSGGSGGVGRRSLNSITAWDSPDPDGGNFGGFPDARGYTVDARTPDSITVPTRQTLKQIQADWSDGPRWEMPFPVGADGSSGGGAGVLRLDEQGFEAKTASLVTGTLVHKMPGALHDIVVIVVRGQRRLPPAGARRTSLRTDSTMVCQAQVFAWQDPWKPGDLLSLDAVTRVSTEAGAMSKLGAETYFNGIISRLNQLNPTGEPDTDSGRASYLLTALAFFSQLPSPDPYSSNPLIAPQRTATHGWDLGRWFTRPCIIIIGQIGQRGDGAPSPVPLLVDGKLIPNSGLTLVRWVYPLPDRPPPYPSSLDAPVDGAANASGETSEPNPSTSPLPPTAPKPPAPRGKPPPR